MSTPHIILFRNESKNEILCGTANMQSNFLSVPTTSDIETHKYAKDKRTSPDVLFVFDYFIVIFRFKGILTVYTAAWPNGITRFPLRG